jgi:hypothetical protein
MDKTTKQLPNVLCRQLQDIIQKVTSEFNEIRSKVAQALECRLPSSGPNQQSQSGRKRTHSKLKSDDDDMQNETSNTNLKITKIDPLDTVDPARGYTAALAPVQPGVTRSPTQVHVQAELVRNTQN